MYNFIKRKMHNQNYESKKKILEKNVLLVLQSKAFSTTTAAINPLWPSRTNSFNLVKFLILE